MGTKLIKDDQRLFYANVVLSRVKRRRSVMIVGKFGAGKSFFLEVLKKQIEPRIKVVTGLSISPIYQMLPGVLRQINHTVKPSSFNVIPYLELLCKQRRICLMIDEIHKINPNAWQYLKHIMDSGIPCIFAGLESAESFLVESNGDIISRLKVLKLGPISVENFIAHMSNWEPTAVESAYGACNADMRVFKEKYVDEAEDKAAEMGVKTVTVDIVSMFL